MYIQIQLCILTAISWSLIYCSYVSLAFIQPLGVKLKIPFLRNCPKYHKKYLSEWIIHHSTFHLRMAVFGFELRLSCHTPKVKAALSYVTLAPNFHTERYQNRNPCRHGKLKSYKATKFILMNCTLVSITWRENRFKRVRRITKSDKQLRHVCLSVYLSVCTSAC